MERWRSAIGVLAAGVVWLITAACEVTPTGVITASEFQGMLDEVTESGGSFTFSVLDLDDEAREQFAMMLPRGRELGTGEYEITGGGEHKDAEVVLESDPDAGEEAGLTPHGFGNWKRNRPRQRTKIKWRIDVCYRVTSLQENRHLPSCPHAGSAGPFLWMDSNRYVEYGNCHHHGSQPYGRCDELIYTCGYCGKPRHYQWTFYHKTKEKIAI
jgi:hypothetical protein